FRVFLVAFLGRGLSPLFRLTTLPHGYGLVAPKPACNHCLHGIPSFRDVVESAKHLEQLGNQAYGKSCARLYHAEFRPINWFDRCLRDSCAFDAATEDL